MSTAVAYGCSESFVLDLPVPSLPALVQGLRFAERLRMGEWATATAMAYHSPKDLSKWMDEILHPEKVQPKKDDLTDLKRLFAPRRRVKRKGK